MFEKKIKPPNGIVFLTLHGRSYFFKGMPKESEKQINDRMSKC